MAQQQSIVRAICGLLAYLIMASTSQAAEIHVPKDHATIQAAIDAAVAGDEVIVAPGTYNENINLLAKAITLRSTEPDNPLVVYATVINGGNIANTIRCISGETPSTVIDGLLITNPAGPNPIFNGAGIRVTGSSPTIRRCVFFEAVAQAGGGGGISLNAGSSPTIEHCLFLNCTAGFIGGSPVGSGGAILCNGSSPTFDHCAFRGNIALRGGAVHCEGSAITFTNCQFDDNLAGGAVAQGGAIYGSNSPATFTDCTFRRNSAGDGGAIFVLGPTAITISGAFFCQSEPNHITGQVTDLGGSQFFIACPGPGACCVGGVCIQATQDDCVAAAGTYQGDGTTCAAANCPAPACPSDIAPPGGDDAVNVSDLLKIINDWGACP